MKRKALTPDQVRQRLRQRGQTLTQWAREHGYDRKAVYRVIASVDKGHYGRAHDIAVDLGLKVPDEEEPSTDVHAGDIPQRKAA